MADTDPVLQVRTSLATLSGAPGLIDLEANDSTGIIVQATANDFVSRTTVAPAAGITITNPAGIAGDITFGLANDLAGVEGLSGTGHAVRTGTDTWTTRTITGTTNKIDVTNGDGVSGNPTLTISSTYAGQNTITTLGTVATGTWQATAVGVGYGGTGLTATPTNGQVAIGNGTGYTLATLTAGTGASITNGSGTITISATGTGGTVTSVAMTVPSIMSVSGSPVTTSGTLAVSLATQTANTVFAGATSGGAATPTFRALVAADIPSLDASKITAGTLAVARGGTGTGTTPTNGKLLIGNGTDYTLANITAGTGVSVTNGSGSITIASSATNTQICQGRLTPSTGVPVTTSDVTSANTIYFTPYKGNQIALYTSSVWTVYTFTERSLSLASASTTYPTDVGIYDNSGTLTLIIYPWTNATTRSTALTTQDGVYVMSGATNVRYLGTLNCEAGPVVNHTAQKRFVWNYYNRIEHGLYSAETGASHNYSTATWREWNASTSYRLQYVVGVIEDAASFSIHGSVAGTGDPRIALGFNTTTTPNTSGVYCIGQTLSAGQTQVARRGTDTTIGANYVTGLQYTGSGTGTYDKLQLTGSFLC